MKNETRTAKQTDQGVHLPALNPISITTTARPVAISAPRSCLMGGRTFGRYATVLGSLFAGIAASVRLQAAQPDYNAPWTEPPQKSTAPKKTEKAKTGQPPPSMNATPASGTQAALPAGLDTRTTLRPPKPVKNEVSASADFFFGSGTVTVPLGYSLEPNNSSVHQVGSAQRSSVYIGGTLSYSFGQAWYLDLSYNQGKLATAKDFKTFSQPVGGPLNAKFNISDNWYQAYLRYTFPKLRGKPFSAYMRAGFTFVDAKLTADGINFGYHQDDKTTDYYGNLGFGVAYNLYTGRRFRLYLQGEAEAFYGMRSQNTTEVSSGTIGVTPTAASINNNLYGGNGRATLRMEYRMGRSGLFKIFADGGLQGKFTQVSYPNVGASTSSASSEYLWGPYVRIGARYAF